MPLHSLFPITYSAATERMKMKMNYFVFVLTLCTLSSIVHSNVLLTRFVFDFPGTPLLQGDQAYLGLLIMFKLMALSAIIGLYRAAGQPAPAGRGRSFAPPPYFMPATLDEVGNFLDGFANSDRDGCMVRLFCELGAMPKESLTLHQRAIVEFLKLMPKWVPTTLHNPRSNLMMAAALGSHGDTCAGLGATCPYDIGSFASVLS